MEALLARLGYQAVNYAMRCGIAVTSTFAVQQCSRLLKTVDDKALRRELRALQKRLNERVKIISPTLDLIEFKSGRGNIFLENSVSLARSLHQDIAALGRRLESAAAAEEASRNSGHNGRTYEEHYAELKSIVVNIKELLDLIDRDTPYLTLAINVSGETLSRSMPPGISPSRFLQGSAFLAWGDTQYCVDPGRPVQIGPSFTLSLYMLFVGHSSGVNGQTFRQPDEPEAQDAQSQTGTTDDVPYGFEDGERRPIWQEVLHKCRVRICRTPFEATFDQQHGYVAKQNPLPSSAGRGATERPPFVRGRPDEFAYHLEIVEDLDDGRVHDDKATISQPFDNMRNAGVRESIPMHQISKIFYTDTGRILNIGDDYQNNSVLLLKREPGATPPYRPTGPLFQSSTDDAGDDSLLLEEGEQPSFCSDDDQAAIDRQLYNESPTRSIGTPEPNRVPDNSQHNWQLPTHLDPEWLAFEVFENEADDDTSDEEVEEGEEPDPSLDQSPVGSPVARAKSSANRTSLDPRLISQIRNISVRSSFSAGFGDTTMASPSKAEDALEDAEFSEAFVTSSPFGAITSSLSLMEMLIRLASLQEFQQVSHLAMPDHILTFFLEETSTTGAAGEEKWKLRSQAKRKVGFDPYSDTPRRPVV